MNAIHIEKNLNEIISFIDSIDREKEGSLFEWGDFDDVKK